MLITSLLSFVAGILTVLAPCVLPFLPVIVGGSLKGAKWRPYVVCASLVISLVLFTILLKATSVLLFIDPNVLSIISGAIVCALGLSMLFPNLWTKVSDGLKLSQRSHSALSRAREGENIGSAIATGAALGPVFSSCSPTYAWVVASILPKDPLEGTLYLAIYCVGLSLALLSISLLGRKLISKISWMANPYGWFQKTIAILFIAVGLMVLTGLDKKVQVALSDYSVGLGALEEQLIPVENEDNSSSTATSAKLDEAFPAPDLVGLTNWINSEPLSLKDLRGKVVLIDFWTYSCINCIRTQPYLNAWYETYKDKGLVILGIHAPEFAFEKVPANVQKAVLEAGISYPVALDNNFETWQAYNNHYWPAKYLIDQQGRVRYTHFGEGDYEETEQAIQELLGDDSTALASIDMSEHVATEQSPETYLGELRASGYVGNTIFGKGEKDYILAENLPLNSWTLAGTWKVEDEYIEATSSGATLSYRFSGRVAHLVMSADMPSEVRVTIGEGSNAEEKTITVQEDKLYDIAALATPTSDTLITLTFQPGVRAYAFTFGS